MLNQSSRSALPQVIQFMASSGRNTAGRRFLLTAIEHVALILGDDQRQPLDPAKIGQRNFGATVGLSAPLVDLASMLRISL